MDRRDHFYKDRQDLDPEQSPGRSKDLVIGPYLSRVFPGLKKHSLWIQRPPSTFYSLVPIKAEKNCKFLKVDFEFRRNKPHRAPRHISHQATRMQENNCTYSSPPPTLQTTHQFPLLTKTKSIRHSPGPETCGL